MKTITGIVGFAAGFAFASLLTVSVGWLESREARALRVKGVEVETQQSRSDTEAEAERDHWKQQAETYKQRSEEVHQLRAEVARLRREQSQPEAAAPDSSLPSKLVGQPAVPTGRPNDPVPFDSAPEAVRSTILKEARPGSVEGLYTVSRNGENSFVYKGHSGDGKSLYLRVAHDGSVLGRRSEIPAENLPSEIRVPVAEAFGDLSISSATEILEDGQLAYELSSKSEAGGMNISVRADGTVMGYSFRSSLNPPKSR